jgi:hypothetical protein
VSYGHAYIISILNKERHEDMKEVHSVIFPILSRRMSERYFEIVMTTEPDTHFPSSSVIYSYPINTVN